MGSFELGPSCGLVEIHSVYFLIFDPAVTQCMFCHGGWSKYMRGEQKCAVSLKASSYNWYTLSPTHIQLAKATHMVKLKVNESGK